MKPPLYRLLPLLTAFLVWPADATTPMLPSLDERIRMSTHVFVGVGINLKMAEVSQHDFNNPPNGSSRGALTLPPGLYRKVEIDVQISDVLKSDRQKLPHVFTVKWTRIFFDKKDMQQSIATLQKTLIGRKRIFLFNSSDTHFSTEDVAKRPEVIMLLKRNMKSLTVPMRTVRPVKLQ